MSRQKIPPVPYKPDCVYSGSQPSGVDSDGDRNLHRHRHRRLRRSVAGLVLAWHENIIRVEQSCDLSVILDNFNLSPCHTVAAADLCI